MKVRYGDIVLAIFMIILTFICIHIKEPGLSAAFAFWSEVFLQRMINSLKEKDGDKQ